MAEPDSTLFVVNNIWMLVATLLVFIMHLGFAALTRSKNTVNILFKNVSIISIGLLTYAVIGFSLMYPGEAYKGGVFGFAGFWIGTDAAGLTAAYNPGYTYWTDFLFQGMFAATAATIISGAVAERVKLGSFLLFATLYVALIYPIVGMWHWGGGFLNAWGFYDFAGSTIVHGVGGWGALAGVLVIGPRLGKYGKRNKPLLGHNLPLATIGAFLLWFGWYGFNGGSVLSADPGKVSLVFVTTSLGAAAGVAGAGLLTNFMQHKPDLTMVLNGALAGLVGITASADIVTPAEAVLIGLIAGAVVVPAVLGLERLRLDDPVGAISVHLVSGVWGTLAAGLFGDGTSFWKQLGGVALVGGFCFSTSFALFWVIKKTIGIRVSPDEEREGLDYAEHGMRAYGDL